LYESGPLPARIDPGEVVGAHVILQVTAGIKSINTRRRAITDRSITAV
jgi:hypothetical protein